MKDNIQKSVRWKGIFWQLLHLGGGGILLIILWAVLGRYWSVNGFGQFNYIFAFSALVGIFIDFGLDVLLTRYISLSKGNIPHQYWYLKAICIVLFTVSFFILGLILKLPLKELSYFLVGTISLSLTAFLNALIRARDQLIVEAKIGIFQKSLFIIGSIYGVSQLNQNMLWVAQCYALSHILAVCLTYFSIHKNNLWVSEELKFKQQALKLQLNLKQLIIDALPLFLIALLSVLTLRIDIFLLQALLDENAVGIYTAAMRLIEGAIVLGTAYQAAVFPKLVDQLNFPDQFNPLFKKAVIHLLFGAILIMVPGILLGSWIIPLLYGSAFTASVDIFIVLIPVLVLVYQTALWGSVFIAMARQKDYLFILFLTLVINVAVDYYAILHFGVMGAVIGFWIKELFLIGFLGVYLWRNLFSRWYIPNKKKADEKSSAS